MNDSRTVPPLTPEQLEALNPGIRTTVQTLREWGFDTRDSGDGQTAQYECDLPIPYVHIAVDAQSIAAETDRLLALLSGRGIVFGNQPNPQIDPEGYANAPDIQASYLPTQGGWAFIHLTNVVLP